MINTFNNPIRFVKNSILLIKKTIKLITNRISKISIKNPSSLENVSRLINRGLSNIKRWTVNFFDNSKKFLEKHKRTIFRIFLIILLIYLYLKTKQKSLAVEIYNKINKVEINKEEKKENRLQTFFKKHYGKIFLGIGVAGVFYAACSTLRTDSVVHHVIETLRDENYCIPLPTVIDHARKYNVSHLIKPTQEFLPCRIWRSFFPYDLKYNEEWLTTSIKSALAIKRHGVKYFNLINELSAKTLIYDERMNHIPRVVFNDITSIILRIRFMTRYGIDIENSGDVLLFLATFTRNTILERFTTYPKLVD